MHPQFQLVQQCDYIYQNKFFKCTYVHLCLFHSKPVQHIPVPFNIDLLTNNSTVLTRGVQYQYQADLVDYLKLKRDHSGYTFVLSIIDCFSRLAFTIPIKRKTGEEVAAALRRAFNHMGDPKKLHTDQGKEFYNRHVKELLQEHGVHHFSTFQDVKAQIVERFNRTLREAILQYMTDRQSLRYVEALSDFLYSYNNRPHSAVYPFSPACVNKQNQRAVHEIQYGDYLHSEC